MFFLSFDPHEYIFNPSLEKALLLQHSCSNETLAVQLSSSFLNGKQ